MEGEFGGGKNGGHGNVGIYRSIPNGYQTNN